MFTTFIVLIGLFITNGIVFLIALDRCKKKVWNGIAIVSCIAAFICWIGMLVVLWQTNFFLEPNIHIG